MAFSVSVCLSGGALGDDPYDPGAWSGSAPALMAALAARTEVAHGFGLSLPRARFAALAAPRFSPDREVWRRRVYRSRAYRAALTRRVAAWTPRGEALLQIGAYADGPSVCPLPVLTYQDGAAATYDQSPFVPEALRRDGRLAAQALAFEAKVAQGAARVLTTSDWLAREMTRAYGLPDGHAVSVGCGVQQPVAAAPDDRDYAAARILFVGKEWERKGGPGLLDAFAAVRAAHPAARLDVVGPPERPQGADAPGVRWHGFLSRRDPDQAATLERLFAKACVLALPSRYEPFGIAPIEAMANGVPAVVTGAWAMAETVTDGIDGAHVAEGDTGALARVLTDLLGTPDRLEAMGRAAARSARAHSWDTVAARVVTLAKEAARGA